MPERYSFWFLLLTLAAVAVAAGLTWLVPGVGAFVLAATVIGVFVVVLPRGWKVGLKLTLRNIGRQRGRAAMTMVALFVGVFAIGLVLFDAGLRDQLD